jgi:glycosyltransferase involved in cell wall biosynthesis
VAEQKIALVHHWLTSQGGAEKVLYELHQMYPNAPIYTTSYIPDKFPEFADAKVHTTFLNYIPWLRRHHQLFPIFLGLPFKTFNMDKYDLVISSCAAEAKYVRTGKNTLHICYCHTPVRYYWTDYEWRMKNMPFGLLNPLARIVYPLLIGLLRRIDYKAAQGVDLYIANSEYIQGRIKRYYNRESTVIYPPIETDKYINSISGKRDYYLIIGRQVASKRLDIAIDAFNELGLTLKIAGSGEDLVVQKPRAKANIQFLGRVSEVDKIELYAGAKGFVFSPEEDFGITPLEAMASGCPVIAYGSGGALESVVEGVTGTFFKEQTSEALMHAIKRFEGMKFNDAVIRNHAESFDTIIFKSKISMFVNQSWDNFSNKRLH